MNDELRFACTPHCATRLCGIQTMHSAGQLLRIYPFMYFDISEKFSFLPDLKNP
jgi:hypothetical protein